MSEQDKKQEDTLAKKLRRDEIKEDYRKKRNRATLSQLGDQLGQALARYGAAREGAKRGVAVDVKPQSIRDWTERFKSLDAAEADELKELSKPTLADKMAEAKEIAKATEQGKVEGKGPGSSKSSKEQRTGLEYQGEVVYSKLDENGNIEEYIYKNGEKQEIPKGAAKKAISQEALKRIEERQERNKIGWAKLKERRENRKRLQRKRDKAKGMYTSTGQPLYVDENANHYVVGSAEPTLDIVDTNNADKVDLGNGVIQYIDKITNRVVGEIDVRKDRLYNPSDIQVSKTKQEVRKIIEAARKQDIKFRQDFARLQSLESLIESGNTEALGIIDTLMARVVAMDVGALAEGDVRRSSIQAQKFADQIQTYIDRRITGDKIDPELQKKYEDIMGRSKEVQEAFQTAFQAMAANDLRGYVGPERLDEDTALAWVRGAPVEAPKKTEEKQDNNRYLELLNKEDPTLEELRELDRLSKERE